MAAVVTALVTVGRVLAGFAAVFVLGLLLVPIGAAVWGLLLLGSALSHGRARRAQPWRLGPRNTSAASIMILNWNGRAFLEPLLTSVDIAIATHGGAHEVIVVDNGSHDDSVAFVRARFPHVRIVQHARNERFVRGYNLAWHAATKDVIVLLNNDMVVAPSFLCELLGTLGEHPQAFAVSAHIEMADASKRGIETGRTAGRWSGGLFKLAHLPVPDDASAPWPCLWAGGGSSAVDRRALLALGGFEALFDPFYYEDASLSYQAWKRGLAVLLAPAARVVHVHRGSSARLRPFALDRVQRRNAHLFAWRSFDDPWMTLAAALLLPASSMRLAARGGLSGALRRSCIEAIAIGSALVRLPQVLRLRAATRRVAARTDREVLALAHSRHQTIRSLGLHRPENAPLRLLMLLARVPRRDADGSWVQFELLRRLGQRHHVTVVALADTPAMAEQANALAPHVARIETMVLTREPARIDLWRQDPPRLRRDFSDAGIRTRLAEVLATEPFDVAQVDHIEMAYALEGLVGGLAAVHVVHEPMAQAVWPQMGSALRRAHARTRAVHMERRLLRAFARIVCMTDTDARVLRQCHGNAIATPLVITHGIDVANYAHSPASAAPAILFVGSYLHDPNVSAAEFAARAVLPRVRAAMPHARLLLAGHDPEGRLAPLRAIPGVEVLGFVADLGALAAAAGCFLAPLREGGGIRSKVLEALAWGKPTVGTPRAFTGIAGTADVHYLVAGDAEGLAAACVRVLADAALRHCLGQQARALVEQHHTAAAMTAAYESLYRTLAGAGIPS